MIIKTTLELVRYIRHHIAGSEHQDVKAVEDFVAMRTAKLQDDIKALTERLIQLEQLVENIQDPEER